jgi:hypothetical protein
MTKDKIAGIAAALSEDARHYLPQLTKRGFSIHPGRQTTSVRDFLREAEKAGVLTNPSFDNYFLTSLGLAVRNHLKDHPHADR